nr:DUF2218 domain-containing protein [Micromonospora sp. DSM 115978]
MPRSEARVPTARASRYLAQLCGHFAHQSHAEWNAERGFADFGWGRCTLLATPEALLLRAEAASEPGLGRVEYVMADHTERFGAPESLVVTWIRADDAGPSR